MHQDKITSLIVDDEPDARFLLSELLKGFHEIELISAVGSVDCAMRVVTQSNPELIFLNVEMHPKTGFDMISELQQSNMTPAVVFTTGHLHYAVEAIRSAAFDYLLKPVDPDDLSRIISKLVAYRKTNNMPGKINFLVDHFSRPKQVCFKTRCGFIVIDPADIFYAEADWNYTQLHMKSQKTEMLTLNLGAVQQLLPPGRFCRINRSILINLDYLTSVNSKENICFLSCAGLEKEFKIPARRIRDLETLFFPR